MYSELDRNVSYFKEDNGGASCTANLAKLTDTHTHAHTHVLKMYPCLFLAVKTHAAGPHTLQHPPQEETTPALPVALMQRSQVPRRSPASFVLTAGRKPSLA